MSAPLKLGFSFTGRGESFAPRSLNHAGSNSASLAEAERTIKRLKEDNGDLRQELNDVRALYKQLTTESTSECFDERRVNLLKAQVIQLERQNSLLAQTISSRSETLMEVENAMAATINFCQSVRAHECSVREVRVSCTELDRIVTTLESARKRLCKMAEKTSSLDSCAKPLLWYGDFLRNRPDPPVTLFDICRGDIEHINLKHVSRLESKLVNLYKELALVRKTLRQCVQSSSTAEAFPAAPTALYGRLSDQVKHSCHLLEDACSQLLQLSLLVPAAPLPALTKPPIAELTVENVVKVFGKTAKTRDAKRLISALVKYVNLSVNHAGLENCLLAEELAFHQEIYGLQTEYVESLFPCVDKCYAEFERDMQDVICQPLKEVLLVFYELKGAADDRSLLHFIEVFRNHSPILSDAVQRLSVDVSEKGNVISEYGTQFLKKMADSHAECKRRRDLNIAKLDAVKQQLTDQTNELLQVIADKDQLSTDTTEGPGMPKPVQTGRKSRSEHSLNELQKNKWQTPAAEHSFQCTENVGVEFGDSRRFRGELATAAMPVPSVAEVSADSQPVLSRSSLSVSQNQPPRDDGVRARRLVPGLAQQSLKLKSFEGDGCNLGCDVPSPVGGVNLLAKSCSFSKEAHPDYSISVKPIDCREQQSNLHGRWSVVGGRTTPIAVRRSSSSHHMSKQQYRD